MGRTSPILISPDSPEKGFEKYFRKNGIFGDKHADGAHSNIGETEGLVEKAAVEKNQQICNMPKECSSTGAFTSTTYSQKYKQACRTSSELIIFRSGHNKDLLNNQKSGSKNLNFFNGTESSQFGIMQYLKRLFEDGYLEIIMDVISSKIQCNIVFKDDKGNTLLHLAAKYFDSIQLIDFILDKCTNKDFICGVNSDNETAIMISVIYKHFNVTEKLLNVYKKLSLQVNDEEKEILYKMAFETRNTRLIKFLCFAAEDVIKEKHTILIRSIQDKFSEAILFFLNSEEWQDIFRRQASDIQSPMQLLLIHTPDTAENLFDKCVKEKQQKYLNELIKDFPVDSGSLISNTQNFCASSMRVLQHIYSLCWSLVSGEHFNGDENEMQEENEQRKNK